MAFSFVSNRPSKTGVSNLYPILGRPLPRFRYRRVVSGELQIVGYGCRARIIQRNRWPRRRTRNRSVRKLMQLAARRQSLLAGRFDHRCPHPGATPPPAPQTDRTGRRRRLNSSKWLPVNGLRPSHLHRLGCQNRLFELPAPRRNSSPHNKKALRRLRRMAHSEIAVRQI